MNTALNIPNSKLLWTASLSVGALFGLLTYFTLGFSALGDFDPLWHIAAGDLIRASGLPAHDSWSFTAGNYRWFNLSWAWDAVISYLHEYFSWQGLFVFNALLIGITTALIFATCFARASHGIAAFLSTGGAMTLLYLSTRPQQITQIIAALWILILAQVARGHMRARWLALLPFTMIFWVNMHGGFLLGPLLIAAFLVHAAFTKNVANTRAFLFAGIASIAALLCNPYGLHVFEGAARTLLSHATSYITEWQPFAFTVSSIMNAAYALLFVLLVAYRPAGALLHERILAYLLLAMSLLSVRYFSVFAIVAAPLIATRLAELIPAPKQQSVRAVKINQQLLHLASQSKTPLALGSALVLVVVGALAKVEKAELPFTLAPEIAYIEKHYPNAKFLNEYALGGLLIYEARGRIPVFIDPRADTAYPDEIVMDYGQFIQGAENSAALANKYGIKGAIFPLYHPQMRTLEQRKDWQKVFAGPNAAVFIYRGSKISH